MLKEHTITFIDYNDVESEVTLLVNGRNIRDWDGKFGKNYNPTVEYKDFWHKVLHAYDGEIYNGCYILFCPDYISQVHKLDWVTEICEIFKKVLIEQAPQLMKNDEYEQGPVWRVKIWW